MFTGLIETTGTVLELTPPTHPEGPTRITFSAPSLAPRLRTGDSVAVSGVCLTALDITLTQFSADLARETVERTKLTNLRPGDLVNLELPTPAGSPLGGHVVQGHVDAVGTLIALDPLDPESTATTDWRLQVAVPQHLARYIAPQGSITLDGISLTVAAFSNNIVSIAIIPHTWAATVLHILRPGAPINIEVDILAKYAEQQTGAPPTAAFIPAVTDPSTWTLTEKYLLANGY